MRSSTIPIVPPPPGLAALELGIALLEQRAVDSEQSRPRVTVRCASGQVAGGGASISGNEGLPTDSRPARVVEVHAAHPKDYLLTFFDTECGFACNHPGMAAVSLKASNEFRFQ